MKDDLPPRLVSVTILSGFLGAGKTTLLSHVLRHAGGLKIGVLVNDFGEVSIDAELIAEITGEVMRLTNGCICCTIRNDVTSSLFQLMERQPLDHVVVESSGLSDPRALAEIFLELQRQRLLRLDGLISVVDAEHFERAFRENEELTRGQILAADLIVLSKTDLVSPEAADAVEAKLVALAPTARVLRVIDGEAPLDALLGIDTNAERPEQVPVHDFVVLRPRGGGALIPRPSQLPRAHGFTSWTFRDERPLAWRELAPVLTHLPAGVFRVKGLLNLAERAGDRILLHVVGGRVHVRTLGSWGEVSPRTELVLIGSSAALDPAALEPLFLACIA